jgi:protein SCO1/2
MNHENKECHVVLNKPDPQRRLVLRTGMLAMTSAWMLPSALSAHANFGAVQPSLGLPDMRVATLDGVVMDLTSALEGSVTALQLMYTGCSATCPIQGAMFAQLQQRLASVRSSVRLVSISIDPRGDDLAALRAWLHKHGAQAGRWRALLPQAKDVDRLQDVLKGRAQGADRHTPQVYVLDRQARLMYRTEDMPSVEAVFSLLTATSVRA